MLRTMIVTDQFVYIHTSRSAGTFLNRLILNHVPGAKMLQYHGHLRELPQEYSHLPVIGFVRNPWDWYVSMCFDYQRKRQYVFEIISTGTARDFEKILTRFLNLGDNSAESKDLLDKLVHAAPTSISKKNPKPRELPGLTSDHFANYPDGIGYYSWLFQLMYESERSHDISIGRFENLRQEMLRLFELTGTPVTDRMQRYLNRAPPMNPSPRPRSSVAGYSPALRELVAEKDKYLIDRFGYQFPDTT